LTGSGDNNGEEKREKVTQKVKNDPNPIRVKCGKQGESEVSRLG